MQHAPARVVPGQAAPSPPAERKHTIIFWHQTARITARELGHRILRRDGWFSVRYGRVLAIEQCCLCGYRGAIDSWEYIPRRLTGFLFSFPCPRDK